MRCHARAPPRSALRYARRTHAAAAILHVAGWAVLRCGAVCVLDGGPEGMAPGETSRYRGRARVPACARFGSYSS
jgi:hypothetical protein